MSQEEIELAFRSPKPNWPGHSAPLEMKHLKTTDAAILTPIFKKYGNSFDNTQKWSFPYQNPKDL